MAREVDSCCPFLSGSFSSSMLVFTRVELPPFHNQPVQPIQNKTAKANHPLARTHVPFPYLAEEEYESPIQ